MLLTNEVEAFWNLIEASRSKPDDPDAQAVRLRGLLEGRSRQELEAFERTYQSALTQLRNSSVREVASRLRGGMSDDGFEYFCDWIISRGRAVYDLVSSDPDALKRIPGADDEDNEAEALRYAVHEAFEATHGLSLVGPPTKSPEDPFPPARGEITHFCYFATRHAAEAAEKAVKPALPTVITEVERDKGGSEWALLITHSLEVDPNSMEVAIRRVVEPRGGEYDGREGRLS